VEADEVFKFYIGAPQVISTSSTPSVIPDIINGVAGSGGIYWLLTSHEQEARVFSILEQHL